jgi:hypothetical protein
MGTFRFQLAVSLDGFVAGPACCTGGMLVPLPGDSDDHLLPDALSL